MQQDNIILGDLSKECGKQDTKRNRPVPTPQNNVLVPGGARRNTDGHGDVMIVKRPK